MAGCVGDSARSPLRIGINAWPGYEFLYLAQEQRLFESEGVHVRIVEYSSLGDARRAFELGQIDGMASTMVEVLQASHHASRIPRIVLVVDYSAGSDVILARPPVAAVSDLRGRRVGIEGMSVNGFVLSRALALSRLTRQDVTIVRAAAEELVGMLARDEVDAVATYPPHSTRMLAAGAVPIFSSRQLPGEILDVLSFEMTVAEQRQGEIEAVIRAFDRAVAYARAHPDEAHAVMARREGISVPEFREALAGMTVLEPAAREAVMREKLRSVVHASEQVLRDDGLLTSASMADAVAAQPWHAMVSSVSAAP